MTGGRLPSTLVVSHDRGLDGVRLKSHASNGARPDGNAVSQTEAPTQNGALNRGRALLTRLPASTTGVTRYANVSTP